MAAKRKLTKAEIEKCKVLSPEFRVSHPHVFTPQAAEEGGKKKYQITMLVPKDSDVKPYKTALNNAKLLYLGPKENWPEKLVSPIRDGDSEDFLDAATGKQKEGYAGHWVIKATAQEDRKPGLVDASGENEIINQGDFYPGCYARAMLMAFQWEFHKKVGISFIVDHIQKTRDGKPLSARVPATKVFSPIEAAAGQFDEEDEDESHDFR